MPFTITQTLSLSFICAPFCQSAGLTARQGINVKKDSLGKDFNAQAVIPWIYYILKAAAHYATWLPTFHIVIQILLSTRCFVNTDYTILSLKGKAIKPVDHSDLMAFLLSFIILYDSIGLFLPSTAVLRYKLRLLFCSVKQWSAKFVPPCRDSSGYKSFRILLPCRPPSLLRISRASSWRTIHEIFPRRSPVQRGPFLSKAIKILRSSRESGNYEAFAHNCLSLSAILRQELIQNLPLMK